MGYYIIGVSIFLMCNLYRTPRNIRKLEKMNVNAREIESDGSIVVLFKGVIISIIWPIYLLYWSLFKIPKLVIEEILYHNHRIKQTKNRKK